MAEADPLTSHGWSLDFSWVPQALLWTSDVEAARKVRAQYRGPAVTLCGSARSKPGDPNYEPGDPNYEGAWAVGKRLASCGVAVITGGGPGTMEAANRGACEEGHPELSFGFAIELPGEEPNDYVDPSRRVIFSGYASRKTSMFGFADGYVFCGGGFGTLDELSEVLVHMQTGRLPRRPIVLLQTEPGMWDWLLKHFREMVDKGLISSDDLALLRLTDNPERAADWAMQPALTLIPLRSTADAVPAWEPIQKVLGENGFNASLLEPVSRRDGGEPVVVVPASWLQAAASGGGRTVGDELTFRLQEQQGYTLGPPTLVSPGVTARQYSRTNRDAGTIAFVNWSRQEKPRRVEGIEEAVRRSRYALGAENHILPAGHRLALELALAQQRREELLGQPWVTRPVVQDATTLLLHGGNMETAAWLARRGGGPPPRRELEKRLPKLDLDLGPSFGVP